LKIAVAECIMQLEASDYSYVKKRIEQVRKDYASLLSLTDYKREKQLLDIIAEISAASGESDLNYMSKKIEKFVRTEVKQEVEDGEILKYRNWLATRYNIRL
jgi:hypothetical protein